jgi:hypothetical protein
MTVWMSVSMWGLAFVLGGATTALGQVALPYTERDAPDWEADYRFAIQYQKGAAIDSGGSVEIMEYALGAWMEGPLSDSVQFHLDASYVFTDYDFGPAAGCSNPMVTVCFTNDPWQDIQRLDVAPGTSLILTPALRLRLSFPLRWNSEGDTDENGVTAGMLVQLQWEMSSRFTAGLGIGVTSELEEDVSVYPAFSLDWKMGPDVRLRTRGGPYQGGTVEWVWSPSDFFQGALSAGYERQRFRLANKGPNPDGIAEATSVPLLLGMKFRASRFNLVVEGGMAVSGDLRIEDHTGQLLAVSDYGSAGILRGYLAFTF